MSNNLNDLVENCIKLNRQIESNLFQNELSDDSKIYLLTTKNQLELLIRKLTPSLTVESNNLVFKK